ncbi:hypothetical protein MP228_005494 [Amoeboaphelidium protococcarum]|nr:hypothetical protein MP228_005494 [Amoeboaphelidium protococcarum]
MDNHSKRKGQYIKSSSNTKQGDQISSDTVARIRQMSRINAGNVEKAAQLREKGNQNVSTGQNSFTSSLKKRYSQFQDSSKHVVSPLNHPDCHDGDEDDEEVDYQSVVETYEEMDQSQQEPERQNNVRQSDMSNQRRGNDTSQPKKSNLRKLFTRQESTETAYNSNSRPSGGGEREKQSRDLKQKPSVTFAPPEDDSDEDSEDDALSVILDQAESNEQVNRELFARKQKTLNEQGWKKLILSWLWKFFKYAFVSLLILSPGTVCFLLNEERCNIMEVSLLRWCFLIVSLVFGYFIADFAVFLAMMIIKRTPVVGTQYFYFISKVSTPAKLWLTQVFVSTAYQILFTGTILKEPGSKYQYEAKIIESIITCALVSSIAFLIKSLLSRFIAINFHRGAYYRRIKNALLSEYVIMSLLKPDEKKRGFNFYDNVKSLIKNEAQVLARAINQLPKGGKEDVDLVTSRLPITEEQLLDKTPFTNIKLAAYVEFIKRNELNLKEGIFKKIILKEYTDSGRHILDEFIDGQPTSTVNYERVLENLTNGQCTRLVAKMLYGRLLPEKAHVVILADFYRMLNPEVAQNAFQQFDGNWNNELTERDFISTLHKICRERTALRSALNDAETAISKLDNAITGFLMLVLLIVYFIIFGSNPQTVLTTVSSFLLASAFAIGNSAKVLLDSIVFLFVTHPFDIGDRVVINDVTFTVVKMSLLTCQFRRFDNTIVFFSNAVLSQLPICNLRRSPDQFDVIKIQVAITTPTSVLRQFESKIGAYLDKNPSHFYKKFEIEYREVENTNRLLMRLWVQHRSNFQNVRRYRERHGRLILRIKRACQNLGIDYELPAQTVTHQMHPTLADVIVNGTPMSNDAAYNAQRNLQQDDITSMKIPKAKKLTDISSSGNRSSSQGPDNVGDVYGEPSPITAFSSALQPPPPLMKRFSVPSTLNNGNKKP